MSMFGAGGLNGDGFFGEEYGDDYEQSEYERSSRSETFYYYPKSLSQVSVPKSVTCRNCGYQNLKWTKTSNGWKTAYSTGPLTDKLHACGDEF